MGVEFFLDAVPVAEMDNAKLVSAISVGELIAPYAF